MRVIELLAIASSADEVVSSGFTREDKLAILREMLSSYPPIQLYERSAVATYEIVRSKIERNIADLETPVAGERQGDDDGSTSGDSGHGKAKAKVSTKKASPKQKG